jgi:uncharacterized protein YkwD
MHRIPQRLPIAAMIVLAIISIIAVSVIAWPATAQSPAPPPRIPLDDMLAAVNAARRTEGLTPLTLNERLNAAACRQARDLAGRALHDVEALSHQGGDGSTLATRLQDAGYSYRAAAENLAAGVADPQETTRLWLASEGHRRNMLTPGFTEAGAARLGARLSPGGNRQGPMDVWVLVLATPTGTGMAAQEAKNPKDCAG